MNEQFGAYEQLKVKDVGYTRLKQSVQRRMMGITVPNANQEIFVGYMRLKTRLSAQRQGFKTYQAKYDTENGG